MMGLKYALIEEIVNVRRMVWYEKGQLFQSLGRSEQTKVYPVAT
jgi:hypothetical protein